MNNGAPFAGWTYRGVHLAVAGIPQVFVMLSSGGEPLHSPATEGQKVVDSFSFDGSEIYIQPCFGP